MSNELSMRDYYAARAVEYDDVYRKPERQADLRAIEQWLAPLFAAARVIEIACGTGYWTQFIAPSASSVMAIDTSPETMSIAKSRVPAGHVQFVVGDAYALPRVARIFDAAFAGCWLSHVPIGRRHEFLLGLNAALRPGAKVVLLDNRYVEGSSSPITERDAEGNTYQSRRLGDGTMHRVLKNFPAPAELHTLAASFGVDARVTQWQYFWALEYAAHGPGRAS